MKNVRISKYWDLSSLWSWFLQVSKGTAPTLYWVKSLIKWAVSQQNQQFATSMDPDQPAHPCSLIRIHAVCLPTLLQVEKLTANSMDPEQTARKRRLVWIHAGRKPTMFVLSWRGSNINIYYIPAVVRQHWPQILLPLLLSYTMIPEIWLR
jgi:hypothetical protein